MSNKRQAFDLTYNGRLIWNGSAMGPPRALKVCALLIHDDENAVIDASAAAAAAVNDDDDDDDDSVYTFCPPQGSHTLQFDILGSGALAAAMTKAK